MIQTVIPDYHLHSAFSGDCSTPLPVLIAALKDKGMTSACITDHNDLDYPETPEHISFDLDIDAYLPELKALRQDLLPEFDLRIGLEQGVQPQTAAALSDYSERHPGLDFIICSTHYVRHEDPYYPEFFRGRNPESCYEEYFREMLYNVSHFQDYSVLGHMDYIFRYGPDIRKPQDFSLDGHPRLKELVGEILRTVIRDKKGIEINTGALYRGMTFAHPHPDILKLYRDLGGTILTFGSDSHDAEHPGYHFREAADFAASLGFTGYCTFRHLEPEFHPF